MECGTALATTSPKRYRPVWLGMLVVIMLWVIAGYKAIDDWRESRRVTYQVDQTFALMFEENVLRTIGEIDKTLLYMRRSLETRSPAESYGSLSTTKDLLSAIIVQVAVLDADGVLRATNAGPQPPPATDLSDRPHFRAHLDGKGDMLYIGQPLIGRASHRLSVQFSRAYHTRDGHFGGVVVASLDPYAVSHFISKTEFGAKASISLVGNDGVVRSHTGANDGLTLGASIIGTPSHDLMKAGRIGSFEVSGPDGGDERVVTLRKVTDQPLWIMVSIPSAEIYRDAREALTLDCSLVAVLTLLIALTVGRVLKIEARRSEAQANYLRLAFRDPLTKLPNRHVFRTKLEDMARQAATSPGNARYAVLFLDLDRFKFVNDTLGHCTGDQLLVEIGKRLSGVLDAAHVLARLGGDEFAIIVPDLVADEDTDVLARRLCESMEPPFTVDRHQIQSGVSIGIALGPADGNNADDILIAADLALYAAKTKSRGTYLHYQRSMSDGLLERRQLEGELRAALASGALELHYQPAVTVKTGRIAGFEALARWQHPARGRVSPSLFISIAEECGLIHALGEWALTRACEDAVTWPADIKVAVNLSPMQFAGPDLVATVRSVLELTGLPAGRLELEITEQTLLENGPRTLQILRSLNDLGVTIALDDFGTGYSSLNYLSNFPFDRIKVDRSFIAKLGEGEQQVAIVQAVIDIARSMRMAVTAEGVESVEQRDKVAALGCGEIQGFFYSRAVPAARIPDLVALWDGREALAA